MDKHKVFISDNVDLYSEVIRTNLQNYDSLYIISGYVSTTMVQKLIDEENNINIKLFIGMTVLEGINRKKHDYFVNLCYRNKNIQVYYRINNPPSHIKLYSWIIDKNFEKNYVGSANFTENGFNKFKEILVETSEINNEIFENEWNNSINCLDPNVEKLVLIHNKTDINEISSDGKFINIVEENEANYNLVKDRKQFLSKKKYLHKHRVNYYDEIKIPILFDNKISSHRRGINNWNRGESFQPYLEESTRNRFSNFFPMNQKLFFITDDDIVLEGFIKNTFSNRLYFTNINLFDYISKRLGKENNTPITYNELLKYGRTTISITKIDGNNYYLDFGLGEGGNNV